MPEAAKKKVAVYLSRVSMAGPIPPPTIIREYGEIVPGLDQKIVEWANTQHNARLEKEKLMTEGAERRMDRAQIFFLVIAILGLCLAAVVGIWGSPWVACVIALVAVGGPSAANILARRLNPGDIANQTPSPSPQQQRRLPAHKPEGNKPNRRRKK